MGNKPRMFKKLLIFFLLATSLTGQEHRSMHCPFLVGVQMPKAESGKSAKLVVYFLPPFTAKPQCKVDFGEAQISQVTVGWVEITAKPETRVDVRCTEVQ